MPKGNGDHVHGPVGHVTAARQEHGECRKAMETWYPKLQYHKQLYKSGTR